MLSEAECYARCYGERGDAVSRVSLPRPLEHRFPRRDERAREGGERQALAGGAEGRLEAA